MLMHLFEEVDQEEEQKDQVSLILFADPGNCRKKFSTEDDLTERYGDENDCIFKRFTLNVGTYYESSEKLVEDLMQDYENYQDKYSDKDLEELQESLEADNSDWIYVHKAYTMTTNCAFESPGSFKVVNHVGKDKRKFFALQNTLEKQGKFFTLFEILGANKLKRFNLGDDFEYEVDGYTFLVSQEPNTDPILMVYDYS